MVAPVSTPISNPANSAAGTAAQLKLGISETTTAITAVNPSTDPTARSIPPVRITNVIPAASTMLMDAWRTTLTILFSWRKFGVNTANRMQIMIRTGSIPANSIIDLVNSFRLTAASAEVSVVASVAIGGCTPCDIGRKFHNVLLSDFDPGLASDLTVDFSLPRDQYAVANTDDFRQFTRDE